MKKIAVALVALALVAVFVQPSFAAMQPMKGAMPGGIAIDSMRVTATVVAVNQAKHTVTLQLSNGKTRTFTAARASDLGVIKKGDKISATLTDMLAVYVEKAGGKPKATETTSVTLMPKGIGAGRAILANTYRVTAKIQYIDLTNRTVTMTWPSGESRIVKVAQHVNLRALKAGDDVVVRFTEALALSLQKPKK